MSVQVQELSVVWTTLPPEQAQSIIETFVNTPEEELQQFLLEWRMLPEDVRRPMLPLIIKHPCNQVEDVLSELVEESITDGERCSYLGALTLRGNLDAAESLLEMEAILGERTHLGQDVGRILYHYILIKGVELANALLVEGNVNKIRALVKHLNRIKAADAKSPIPTVDKLMTEIGRLSAGILQSGTSEQRRGAIELLSISPIILPLWLTKAFREKHIYIRAMVMRIINRHLHAHGYESFPGASPESIGKLVLKGLQDPSPLVREKAVLCLKIAQVPDKIGFLKHMATSEFEVSKVRLAAISTLSELLDEEQLQQLLVSLRDDRRYPVRLFARELEQDLLDQEITEELTRPWHLLYSEAGHHHQVDRLLATWLEQSELPLAERYEGSILQELAQEVRTEYGVRQVLDFYGEWEERFLQTGSYRQNVEQLSSLRQLLRIFNSQHVPILAHILAVEKDLHLRLATIEALSELVLENVEVELVKEVLLNHLLATYNPPDQERVLSVLYVFPREAYLGLVVPFLSSPSPNVAVRAASILSSFDIEQVSCYNSKRIVAQIMRNVGERRVFGKFWADLTVYTARICTHEQCDLDHMEAYLKDSEYMVRRFAQEVVHHISKM